MTIAVDMGRKATKKQTNKVQIQILLIYTGNTSLEIDLSIDQLVGA